MLASAFRCKGEANRLALSVAGIVLVAGIASMEYFAGAILLLSYLLYVKIQQAQLLGGSVRVSAQQMTDVDALVKTAATRLDVEVPQVFVRQDPTLNAFALGTWGRKAIVLHSALVEALTPEELLGIIGHELSHIKCRHTLWLVFLQPGVQVPFFSQAFAFLFMSWSRKAEYTCDRGALLASRNLETCVTAFAKMAVGAQLYQRLNLPSLIHQGTELREDSLTGLAEMLQTHPFLVKRIQALWHFHSSEIYAKLIATHPD